VADRPKSFLLTAELHAYLLDHCAPRPDAVLDDLAAETARLGDVALMQIAPEQGMLLTLLARLVGARRAVEVGTFTGYSSICIARGLAPGGRLLCCDVSEEWTAIARRAWDRAGLADRIELRLAPALDTLRSLPEDPHLDLVFLDADKPGYVAYYDELVPRLRPGGLLLADNVLWMGLVTDPSATDEATEAIRRFNDHVRDDPRVESLILPVADGLTVARRLP
jgi:caffeoyl-CoA O-methyltransferase